MDDVTIIIVNYNAGEHLSNCLESIDKFKDGISIDVWVVDNASTDGSIEKARRKFSKAHFLINKENVGFGSANNQVLKHVKTPYILLFNPDSQLKKDTLKFMIEFMDKNPDVGVATCKVVKSDGSLDWASHRGFPTPLASMLYFFFKNDSLYHLTKRDFSKDHEVDAVAGAFFLTRKKVLDEVGCFDEDYFLYAEDLDLCYRIKKAGYKIMYVPEVSILHLKGLSSGIKAHSQQLTSATKESRLKSFNSFYQTMLIFYKKNLALKYPFFINWLVYLGIKLKWWLDRRRLIV